MTIRESNYIMILAPMITKLRLKGNELLIFALIHGFSQDGETSFKGSLSYLNQWTGLDKSTIISLLKKLVERKFLKKIEYENNKVKCCEYISNYFDALGWLENPNTPQSENPNTPRLENPMGVVGKSNSILTDIYNIKIDNNKGVPPPLLFPETEIKDNIKSKKTLFSKSSISEMVKFDDKGIGDYSEFELQFNSPEFKSVDLIYYFHVVSDWSDIKNMKRTKKGWIATIRNFIRGDIERGKLHLKSEYKLDQNKINVNGAMEFLNDY